MPWVWPEREPCVFQELPPWPSVRVVAPFPLAPALRLRAWLVEALR